jgi:hypothetical protein
MKNILLGLAFSFSFLSACGDYPLDEGPTADFNLVFQANYSGEQAVKYQKYNFGTTDYPVYFDRFRTYISDVYLIKGSDKIPVVEILDVNFFPDDAPNSMSVKPQFALKAPPGKYDGIGFHIGVKPALNNKRPIDFDLGHPLRNEIEYWSGWKSFIFTKLEGKGDADKNSADDLFLQYHTGSDPTYVEIALTAPITILDSNTADCTVSFDIKRILTQADGNYYDLVNNPMTSSSASDLVVSQYIANAFTRASTVYQ